jgi:hypothetical protein
MEKNQTTFSYPILGSVEGRYVCVTELTINLYTMLLHLDSSSNASFDASPDRRCGGYAGHRHLEVSGGWPGKCMWSHRSDQIISGFKEQSLQICYRADSIEPAFDAHTAGYVDFLDAVIAGVANFEAGRLYLTSMVCDIDGHFEYAQLPEPKRGLDRGHVAQGSS